MDARLRMAFSGRGVGRVGDVPLPLLLDLLERADGGGGGLRSPWDEIARWFDTKPAFAKWFTHGESQDLAVLSTKQELTAFVIPSGCFGVLRFFSNSCGNVADYPNVRFSLDIDTTPLEGFASIIGPIAPSIQAPIPMMDGLTENQRVRVTAVNLSSSIIPDVAGFIRGWYWPAQLAPTPKG